MGIRWQCAEFAILLLSSQWTCDWPHMRKWFIDEEMAEAHCSCCKEQILSSRDFGEVSTLNVVRCYKLMNPSKFWHCSNQPVDRARTHDTKLPTTALLSVHLSLSFASFLAYLLIFLFAFFLPYFPASLFFPLLFSPPQISTAMAIGFYTWKSSWLWMETKISQFFSDSGFLHMQLSAVKNWQTIIRLPQHQLLSFPAHSQACLSGTSLQSSSKGELNRFSMGR